MSDDTDFLYPFIEHDEHDAGALLADLGASAVAKGATSADLQLATLEHERDLLDRLADEMSARFAAARRHS